MVADGNATSRPAGTPGQPPFDRRTTAAGPVGDVGLQVRELAEFASYYVAAQVDRFKLTAINIAMFAVLGLMALAIGLAVVFTAAVLLVVGIADGVAALSVRLLGEYFAWLGDFLTAAVILGGLFAAVVIGFKVVTKSTRGKVVASYEQRKSKQRADLGTDVGQASGR